MTKLKFVLEEGLLKLKIFDILAIEKPFLWKGFYPPVAKLVRHHTFNVGIVSSSLTGWTIVEIKRAPPYWNAP